MYKVFVYGTLKSGFCNNWILKDYMGTYAVAKNIDIHTGPNFPFAVRGTGTAIGEMYKIDKGTLKVIDKLEGHPQWYNRKLIEIKLANGQIVKAWIYLNEEAYAYPKIQNGNWQK